jgi:hypothetical protein
MLFINRAKLYSLDSSKETINKDNKEFQPVDLESIGNKNATICCFLSCSSPVSGSKDYKILAKVFEKLMMRIENIYVVNLNLTTPTSFIHFIHEFQFSKIILFGDHTLLDNIPVSLSKNSPSSYERLQILWTENLIELTESKDLALKQSCWNAIQTFYKS